MKIDSQLERNSFLIWKYYANDGVPFQQSMKFYENIKVSERGKTRYSTQSPIGRNSSVFVYMGTESRSFRVQFNLTLPPLLVRNISLHAVASTLLLPRFHLFLQKSLFLCDTDIAAQNKILNHIPSVFSSIALPLIVPQNRRILFPPLLCLLNYVLLPIPPHSQ